MLKSISCESLIENPIVFKQGLNAVVGADDAHNSIGKSSVLMLIDFAFGGSDFPSKCDDVIRNVGDFKVGVEFVFDKSYSFVRDTASIDRVYCVDREGYISISEFNDFLKGKYLLGEGGLSFRECVSGFFRIDQRNNCNDVRPLDVVRKESWDSIRKRILKIFGKYHVIEGLEKEKAVAAKLKKDISGVFNSGAVKKVTKAQVAKNEFQLVGVEAEIEAIKNSLKVNVTDIRLIINERNLALKKEKDQLVDLQYILKSKLVRVESNLSGNTVRNSNAFKALVEFFPEIDKERLLKVEGFHQGITKILKGQLQLERKSLLEGVEISGADLKRVDGELLQLVNSKEDAVCLLERLMVLDRNRHDIKLQNEYWGKSDQAKIKLSALKNDINNALVEYIAELEVKINSSMESFIKRIYLDNPIAPKVFFDKSDYRFDHGDDRGTGKGYANMICLDLAFLDSTILPCLIHDSLLFKNMDVPSVERLISVYDESKKQIFISFDEKSKYSKDTQVKIDNSMFLKLDENRVAFKLKWNNKLI